MKKNVLRLLMIAMALVLLPAGTFAEEAGGGKSDWQFGASIYGWFPDISGQTAFTPPSGSGEFTVDIGDILENLEFTMMGMVDIHKGRWGVVTDLIYMDVGASQSGIHEMGGLPPDVAADVNLDLTSWIWTTAGSFRAVETPSLVMNVIAGVRYLDIEQALSWNLTGNIGPIPPEDHSGSITVELANWDAIAGVRGRLAFGRGKALFIPYEFDVGAGDSDLTWQGAAGLGYSFGWWEIAALWRYLYYDLSSENPIDDMNFGGPVAGVSFRW